MKNIIPSRILITLNEDGSYKDAILIYKIRDELGRMDGRTHSMSIHSKISIPIISGLAIESKTFVAEQMTKTLKTEVT